MELPSELIRKKRFGGAHTREEIRYFIQGYAQDQIPEYQIAAWLMAICCRGMTDEETAWLTQEMCNSGVVLDLRELGVTVDKHSTGGVGDKVSLILAPLVAAAGVHVPMMAGRGLGHTGGTLDKLESIPGFSVKLSFEQFKKQVSAIGTAIMGQTTEICPADRKLYALRDVTGTIDSLPLICGSIMSKKLAEGMTALILDVKFGSGAFMKTLADAETLARALMDIGTRSGRKVISVLSRMDEPLGRFVGNALEVRECLDIMDGKKPVEEGKDYSDTIDLTVEIAAHMILLGEKVASLDAGRELAARLLREGKARDKFNEICRWQGGDIAAPLPPSTAIHTVTAESDGYLHYLNVESLGSASVLLGAGRRFHTDLVDPGAGLEIFRRQGDHVRAGQPLFRIFAREDAPLSAALTLIKGSFAVSTQPVSQSPLIAKVLT